MKLIITDLEDFSLSVEGEHRVIRPSGSIRHCVGCFGCWVKTPGKCVIHDGYENTGIDMGACSELILVSRCCYGSVSPFIKMVQDRAISYAHPDFVIRGGRMHHKRRYKNIISLSAYFYGDGITQAERDTAEKIVRANADNYDGRVKAVRFFGSAGELEGLAL